MNAGAGRARRQSRAYVDGTALTTLSQSDHEEQGQAGGDQHHAPIFPQEPARRRPPLDEGSASLGGRRYHHHGTHQIHYNNSASRPPSKSAAATGLAAASQLLQFDEHAPMRLALVLGVLIAFIALYFCCRRCGRKLRRRQERHDDIVYQPLSIKEFESAQISDLDSDDDVKVDFRHGRNRK